MSAALRDERASVYSYSDTGTGGRAAPTYTKVDTYWTRRSTPTASEATVSGQAAQRIDAVFEFAGGVSVPADGAIRHQDGTLYKIVGVKLIRSTSGETDKIVDAVFADEMSLATVGD